jgi:hypothetical protein
MTNSLKKFSNKKLGEKDKRKNRAEVGSELESQDNRQNPLLSRNLIKSKTIKCPLSELSRQE